MMSEIANIIAQEINAQSTQVDAAIRLLDEGSTVPFIARYRKEVTGSLDDTQLRTLATRLRYLRELAERRTSIIHSIRTQDKLTPNLLAQITQAQTKTELEDLYLPFKPKRRTKAQIAREAGLAPLAHYLLMHPQTIPSIIAEDYLNPAQQIHDIDAALTGARFIIMEYCAEQAELLKKLRELLWEQAVLIAKVHTNKADVGTKFADYFDFSQAICQIPSHRALALFRGQKEEILGLTLHLPEPQLQQPFSMIMAFLAITSADKWLVETIELTWKAKLLPSLTTEILTRLRETAETEAIRVFATNLRALLLAAPAGNRAILGIDPGMRTGCKVACIDTTGKVLATTTIYPHLPQQRWEEALETLANLCQQYDLRLVAIGNGTASRETMQLVIALSRLITGLQLVVISEAGASVYSASAYAAQEFPDLDVSLRGAVSIARRLQDPLAELVKIEPKAIGVGQYQHDVSQTLLSQSLDAVVEDCVNAVGVDVNTASSALLARVAGLNQRLAHNIVQFRDDNGAFTTRAALKKVPRLGEKTYEQAIGFLRIRGHHPLDQSGVHPEAYPIVERIVKSQQLSLTALIGNRAVLRNLNPQQYVCERFGLPTVMDIIRELEKPGHDPRPDFVTAKFKEGIESMADLRNGMILQGVITNVANFGAFVDIGVHQDGLVHISALSEQFVKDPHQVVKVGQIVQVKVIEVDLARRRIQLTMRLDTNNTSDNTHSSPKVHQTSARHVQQKTQTTNVAHHPFADVLKKLKE